MKEDLLIRDEHAMDAMDEREKLAAETARQSYRELAEAMPQQVWTAKPDGSLDYVNERVIEYSSYSRERLLGAGWADILHPDDVANCVEVWTRSLTTGVPYEIEFRLLRASDEQYRWHLGRAVPMRNPEGEIVRWIGTNTDIHDRKRIETELQAARAAADLANSAKSQFLANMSHELRTPLNAVIGYSELLQEEATELGLTHLIPDLQRIHGAGGYLLSLINNVLDLSKIEAGKMEVLLEEFPLVPVLQNMMDTVQPLMKSNRNRLELLCPEDPGAVRADRTKLHQCLLNLLSNAAKFTSDGNIRLEVIAEPETLMLRVTDSGIGMSPEDIAGLFKPFAQAHAGRQKSQGGTGLGLAITREFCQLMGGKITVESEVGKGSAFTIWLPRFST